MGEVWVAKQTDPVKRKVALKLIKAGMDRDVTNPRMDTLDKDDVVRVGVHHLSVVDGHVLAAVRPQ